MLNVGFKNSADVVVVIPVKNGYPEIKACIEGWLSQSISPTEILVIDSGSTDETLTYLQTKPQVRVVSIDPGNFNHGETRNLGVNNAHAEYLLFTVQDARPVNAHVLENMLQVLQTNANIDAVCGQQIVPHELDKNPVDWFRPIDAPSLQVIQSNDPAHFEKQTPEEKKRMTAWDNVIALYRRTALIKIPFETVVFGEDLIWAKSCLMNGGTIAYQTAARVYHYHQETPDFVFRRTLATMYLRYKQLGYFQKPERLTWYRIFQWIKLIGLGGLSSIFKSPIWLRYNWLRFRAVNRARQLFQQQLNLGENALDEMHAHWCTNAPSPTKK
jgi:rhamnosyltransferase